MNVPKGVDSNHTDKNIMATKKPINPAPKHPEIENLLEKVTQTMGMPRSTAFSQQKCVTCKGDASKFKSALCEKEYSLSGMCQKCQDNFFE